MPGEVSIYRLSSRHLDLAVRRDVDRVTWQELSVYGQRALRVDRISADRPPEWAATLREMTGRPFDHTVRSAGAVLLVDLGTTAYALTFGTGWRLLRPDAYDLDFGLGVAIRTLRPDRIAEVTRSALSTEARLDLTHMAGGRDVRTFGIERYAEIVKKIGGRSDSLDVSHRGSHVKLDGRDALRVRVGAEPERLLHDLRAIEAAAARDPDPELAFIEGLRPLAGADRRRLAADRALRDLLSGGEGGRWGISMPVGLLGLDVSSYTVSVGGLSLTVDDLAAEVVTDLLAPLPGPGRLDALRAGEVLASVDGLEEPLRSRLDQWITADLAVGRDRYIYQEGRFYVVTDAYSTALRAEAAALLADRPAWTLPPWPPGMTEGDYNEWVGAMPGFVVLDKRLARSSTHPAGIEICDLLSPDGRLVCVKRADRSSPLSHLFSQAIVAAEALVDGEETYQRLLSLIPPERRASVPRRPGFVLAVQLKRRELTPESLFTFSLVTLHRTARHLQRLHMPVSLMAIPSS